MELVKVRMLVQLDGRRVSEVAEYTSSFARDLVDANAAEYVTEDKSKPFPERKGRRDKMLRATTSKG